MLGEKIRDLRKQNKMTQQDLSNELNNRFGLKADRVMISKWETGFQTPVVYTISCLAKIFGVSMDYLNSSSSPTPKHSFDLSEHESELILAYRNHPEMQLSVDKLLGLESDVFTVERLTAARKEKGGGAEKRAMDDSEKEAVINKTFGEGF